MYVLGIETSCDETAAAVVAGGVRVLSNVVSSTLALHKKYGGVIPEIAARGHLEVIDIVVIEALKKARIRLKDVGLIGVTRQPGLPGALLVGNTFADALSFALKRPLVAVDHTLAHLYAPFLATGIKKEKVPGFPFVGLVVSGGHTSLIYFKSFRQFRVLGATLDDAAGEAFDKVAKILCLGYPGGPEIDRLAKSCLAPSLKFNCAQLKGSFDFSFSGIKTSVLYFARDWQEKSGKEARSMPLKLKAEIASAFQKSVVSILIEKSILACKQKKVRALVIGGGVSANSMLREELSKAGRAQNLNVYFSQLQYCLDNAAMVAGLAYQMKPKLTERKRS